VTRRSKGSSKTPPDCGSGRPGTPDFLSGGGEMGALMRAHDWSHSSLGHPTTWPQPLRTAVRLLLNTGHPMYIWWGEDGACLYNDAYRQSIGSERHPGSLGLPARQVWDEIWDIIGPQIEQVMAGRGATWHENHLVPITRNGRREDVYWTYSYSPIDDDTAPNGVGGVLVICTETTQKVVAEQRLAAQIERQRRLFEQAPGFIAILRGPEHVFEFVNAAYTRLAGDRDFIGRPVREVLPEVEGQGFFELLDTVYTTGERFIARQTPLQLRPSADGRPEERFLDFIYEPVTNEFGEITGIFVEGHDVTEQVRAVAGLRDSDARVRAALAVANLGTFEWNLQTDAVVLDDRSREIFRLAPGEGARAQDVFRRIDPSDLERVFAEVEASRRNLSRLETEYGIILPDGTVRTIISISEPVTGAESKVERMFGVFGDITARKREEARRIALIELADRFRDLESPADLAFAAAEVMGRTLNVSRAGYGTIDPKAETITIERDWNAPGIKSIAGTLQFRSYGSYIEDLKRGDTVVVADADKDPRTAATADALKAISAQAFVNMPVTERGGFVALLYLNHASAREWPAEELDFVRDIAERTRTAVERRRAERELRELAASLEQQVAERTAERDRVWQNSRDLLVVMGVDGRFRAVNPAWTTLLGHRRQDLVGKSFLEFVWPEDADITRRGLERAATRGDLMAFENRYTHHDGTSRWISWHTSLEGDLIYAYGRDVTAEKAAGEALRHSEELLRSIFETSYQYQGLLALDGALHKANAASLAGIKAKLEDVLGKPFWETPWFDATPGMADRVRRAIPVVAKGDTVRQEILVKLPTGWRSFDFTMRPLRDEHGAIVAIVFEAADITERRQAEEALRQSQKLEAMGQLTGGVAHDFNNLLTPIIGSLDMLKRRRLGNDREQRLIDGALQSADRAKTLVQRLLAFARRQPLQPTSVDVAGLVSGMADLVASTTGPQIKVVVDVADDLPSAKADANQLEMGILNLAVNARDAMSDGGTLRISAASDTIAPGHRSKLEPGDYVRLSVADTGTGMDEATLARAIEPFFSTKGIGKGTGLGLSMIHGLVSQLGGALALSSKPGLGTNVELWLPVAEEAAEMSASMTPAEPAPAAKGSVLLVDDEVLIRMSTADMLSEVGYKVIEASSAEQALELIDSGLHVDVLVTDHLMPGMSGGELARTIQDRWPQMPVLIVSGYAEADGISPGLPCLTKPFRQSDLTAVMANLTSQKGQ
jgi:PAS domain S-box-containing protein